MTISEQFSRRGCCTGFVWLRLLLALGIFTFHSVTISYGSAEAIPALPAALARLILPMFFALSGFLVASSLARSTSLVQFAVFRATRLLPALAVIVLASMFVLGPLVTSGDRRAYFFAGDFFAYFGNLVAHTQYGLPGVFLHNPRPGVVNGSLWTIPIELCCYLLLVPAFMFGLIWRRKIFSSVAVTLLILVTAALWLKFAWIAKFPAWDLLLPFLSGVALFANAEWLPCSGAMAAGFFGLALLFSSEPQWSAFAAAPLAYATVWLGLRALPPLPGDYSYGLYLAGYPLQQTFVEFFPHGPWWNTWLVCMPLALGCAAFLWHFVEKPVLARKAHFVARLALPKAAAAPAFYP